MSLNASPGGVAVAAPPRPSPLLAFAELRARLLLRRLRGRGGIPELVARIALFAVAVPAGLAFAVLAGAGAWRAVRGGPGLQSEVAVAALASAIGVDAPEVVTLICVPFASVITSVLLLAALVASVI